MVMFSELLRYRLRDTRNAQTQLVDLAVDLSAGEYPVVTSVLFGSDEQPRAVAWEAIVSIDARTRHIHVDPQLSAARALPPEELASSALVKRDMMDALVVDVPRRQTMRANDLWFEESNGQLLLKAVDIGAWAMMRRLARGLLGQGSRWCSASVC